MNTFLTILCCLVVLFGLFLIVQYLRSKTYAGDAETLEYKDGLPILPRDKRDEALPVPTPEPTTTPDIVPDEPMQSVDIDLDEVPQPKSARELAEETKADALSSLAMVASQNPTESPKYTIHPEPDNQSDVPHQESAKHQEVIRQAPHQDFTHQEMADGVATQMATHTSVEHSDVSYENEQETDSVVEKFSEPSNEFNQNSPMLDRHLIEQQAFDQNNDPLLNAQDTVTIVITPRNQYVGLSGKEVLNIVRNYGLKYGVMNMYHRYEREDGMGDLWFSMMGVDYNGVQVFDLNTLPDAHFTGLSLFLSLPHPHALRGFESMVSTARMIAKDLNADIHDEEGYLLDDGYIEKIRLQVADYVA
ncbi:cell division protein ZipA C-terminal FtsZ-binding domain-containing protein [Moraxella oblonga]|uniref:cell division protein ZipA C-terminal FtsZ-binding domain-containing protein n=1 Tax=Moraxella oblonga TaxID=200413 RepID=UPI000837870B|nr:cell division protein ZipA C-terminal FtsZ-binding domain-containing protein [Moraxella oblonga]